MLKTQVPGRQYKTQQKIQTFAVNYVEKIFWRGPLRRRNSWLTNLRT